MSNSGLPAMIVCGTVRNGGTGLSETLATIERIRIQAQQLHCIIITNDNSDGTDAVLAGWCEAHPTNEVIRMDGLTDAYPHRVDRIAAARNQYLSMLRASRFDSYPVTCVLDLDGVNASVRPDDIAGAMLSAKSWDALFANQRRCYYDISALRHPAWSPEDAWDEVLRANRRPFRAYRRRRAVVKSIFARQYHIPSTTRPIPVDSAFGGLGVYKTELLRGAWYGSRHGDRKGSLVCEHVILHRKMRDAGARLFIAPSLLNDAPEEHLGPGSGAPFPGEYQRDF
jgi:hypothetical protein